MTDSVAAPRIPYGAWPSPITAADVAKGQVLISYPLVIGADVWWQEGRPDEGGRVTVVHCDAAGKQRAVLPAPWNARTRVHEYGGRSYLPVPRAPGDRRAAPARRGAIVFANYADQRLYLMSGRGPETRPGGKQAAGAADRGPGPADPAGPRMTGRRAALRGLHARPRTGTEVWCVQERHDGRQDQPGIVAVPLDGSARPRTRRPSASWSRGSDFFAFPRRPRTAAAWPGSAGITRGCPGMAPNCGWPRSPDGELRTEGGWSRAACGSRCWPRVWRDETSLYVVSDWPGWWNLYQVGLVGEPAQALYPAEEEFAEPLWQLGGRPFAVLGDGRLAVLHGLGGMRLGLLDPETGEMTDLDLPFEEFASRPVRGRQHDRGGGRRPADPAVRGPDRRGDREVRGAAPRDRGGPRRRVPAGAAPGRLEGQYGRSVHALVYPPTHPEAVAPDGELPPYVVWVHGGPTSHVGRPARPGEGVLHQPRHRDHRRELRRLHRVRPQLPGAAAPPVGRGGRGGRDRRRRWRSPSRVEADPAPAGDPRRLGRRLDRAGRGHHRTAARQPVFSAATSYYGVADLREFAAETHDFESHYLDGLIGPLPGFEYVYAERSPAGHVTDATCPVLLLQGLDDPIVPPRAGREHRGRPGRARHPARPPHVQGRVARLPQGRDDHRRAGGGAVVLRPGARLHPARHPAAAPHRARQLAQAATGGAAGSGSRAPGDCRSAPVVSARLSGRTRWRATPGRP